MRMPQAVRWAFLGWLAVSILMLVDNAFHFTNAWRLPLWAELLARLPIAVQLASWAIDFLIWAGSTLSRPFRFKSAGARRG
jgi:hypothetical protein